MRQGSQGFDSQAALKRLDQAIAEALKGIHDPMTDINDFIRRYRLDATQKFGPNVGGYAANQMERALRSQLQRTTTSKRRKKK